MITIRVHLCSQCHYSDLVKWKAWSVVNSFVINMFKWLVQALGLAVFEAIYTLSFKRLRNSIIFMFLFDKNTEKNCNIVKYFNLFLWCKADLSSFQIESFCNNIQYMSWIRLVDFRPIATRGHSSIIPTLSLHRLSYIPKYYISHAPLHWLHSLHPMTHTI